MRKRRARCWAWAVGTCGDFISLTDMPTAEYGGSFIPDWLRDRGTVEFLGIWEHVHDPDLNYGGFAAMGSEAGPNNYRLSV
jgi:hypothetical protein